jgi:hypothetical protein
MPEKALGHAENWDSAQFAGVARVTLASRCLDPAPSYRATDIAVWLGDALESSQALALASTIRMTALMHGIVRSATAGWTGSITPLVLMGGALLLALFVLNEWRVEQPIMPLASSRAALGFWFVITQFLQGVYGYTPLQAGIAFLPMTIQSSRRQPHPHQRAGHRRPTNHATQLNHARYGLSALAVAPRWSGRLVR